MARLPASGVTMATPFQDGPNPRVLGRADLEITLGELCPDFVFEAPEVDTFYRVICAILGTWSAENGRQDSSQLARAISGIQRDLEAVANTLNALDDGLHEQLNIEIVHQLRTSLVSNPDVGSLARAEALLSSFKLDAERIAHCCLIAAESLRMDVGKSGRPQHDWHDEFTELLHRIADKAGIEPQLWKDREDGDWHGWLLDAAQKLETFFSPAMRSPSPNASGMRLERSKLRIAKRQAYSKPRTDK
jgi:hypothetical protein